MKYTNKQNLPETLYRALSKDDYVKVGHYTASGLTRPVQISELERRYSDTIEIDVSDKIYILIGNNVHYILEKIGVKNALQEERLEARLGNFSVTGKPDFYDSDFVLSDYKVTTRYALIDGVKPEWEAQQNVYAWLLGTNGFKVPRAQIIVIFRDWSKIQAMRDKEYPQHQAAVLSVNLWGYYETEKWIYERININELAKVKPDSELPECTAKERWEKPTTWAVKKKKLKKAKRVLGSYEEAIEYTKTNNLDMNEYFIEKRLGESPRCLYYCNVRDYCHQYKTMRG